MRTRRSTAFVNSRRVQGSRSRLFTYCWCSAVLCLSVRLVVGGSSRSLASLLTGFYVSCALPFVFYLSVPLVRFWSIFLFFVGSVSSAGRRRRAPGFRPPFIISPVPSSSSSSLPACPISASLHSYLFHAHPFSLSDCLSPFTAPDVYALPRLHSRIHMP